MESKDESLIDHLEALRNTLIKCFSALGIFLIPMFLIAPKCLDLFIKLIIRNNDIVLNYFSPVEVFVIQIKIAFLLDIIFCFPYIAKQVWNFFLPALYENERKFVSSIVLSSSLLFILGVAFCGIFILPLLINFGMSFSTGNIHAVFGISNVVNLSLWMSLVFGIMFQLPLITYSLVKNDIISYEDVASKRSYIIIILLILAGILTPPDIVSQVTLFVPTYLLFEISLFFVKTKFSKNN